MRRRPVPQDPTACTPRALASDPFLHRSAYWDLESELKAYVNVPPMSCQQNTFGPDLTCLEDRSLQMLLRKEVIQPHLPVRLPCYDLVLITDPTFDGSLHKG